MRPAVARAAILVVVFAGVAGCASPRPGDPATERGDGGVPADGRSDTTAANDAPMTVDVPPAGDSSGGSAPEACVRQTEVCDGRDNDCDGERDEGLIEDCRTACGQGTRRCMNGRWDDSRCPRAPAAADPMACGTPGDIVCEVCKGATNGAPACRGGVCFLDCQIGHLRCNGTPGSCIRSSWSFESGGTEGFMLGSGSDAADGFSVSSAQVAEGNVALSIPATFGNNSCVRDTVEVWLHHCGVGGSSDLAGKMVTYRVYLDGPPLPPGDVELTVGGFSGGSTRITAYTGRWFSAYHQFGPTDMGISGIYFRLRMVPRDPPPASTCLAWKGTIYLDGIRIQ